MHYYSEKEIVLKILYDHQIFEAQKFGGISRYFYELISSKKEASILSLNYSNNNYILSDAYYSQRISAKEESLRSFFWGMDFRGKHRLFNLRNRIFPLIQSELPNSYISELLLNQGNFDIFHPTYYNPYFLNYLNGKDFVVTVYDMIHEYFEECFPKSDPIRESKKLLCEKAGRIIAISESTKRDLIDLLRINPEKINVIYLGSSISDADILPVSNIPKKYILFTGTRAIYKNFNFFIRSIKRVLKDRDDLHVVCTGPDFTKNEVKLFDTLGITERMHHYFVSDRQLAFLYSKAISFVFPSLYEGFGIPVLEAFSCGCPAVLSNTSSLPEVGGVGAVYFDPEDMTSIRESIEDVLNDSDLRAAMIKKGRERAKQFSWKKTVKKTWELYSNIANR